MLAYILRLLTSLLLRFDLVTSPSTIRSCCSLLLLASLAVRCSHPPPFTSLIYSSRSTAGPPLPPLPPPPSLPPSANPPRPPFLLPLSRLFLIHPHLRISLLLLHLPNRPYRPPRTPRAPLPVSLGKLARYARTRGGHLAKCGGEQGKNAVGDGEEAEWDGRDETKNTEL